jgi:hypothetical protein
MRSRDLIVVAALIAALGLALAGCHSGGEGARENTGKLTQQQYETAVNVARHEVENQDAEVTSATAILKRNAGKNAPSNTGQKCTSDRVFRIRLIGTFPHTDTSGGPPGGDPNGGKVTEMDIKADAVTGDACLIGVGTSKHPKPEAGATVLQLDG